MPPELVALTEGPDLLLDKPILLLGRHHECDIQLNSRKVSRRHCCIAQVNDYLVIRDLFSTNGIRINGEKVIEGRLNPGDEVTVGNFSYRVRWIGHPAQPEISGNGSGDKRPLTARLVGTGGEEELESCEEPVALDSILGLVPDPDAPAQSSAAQKPSSQEEKDPPSQSSESKKPVMEDQPPSLILPDNLNLAPFSDEFSKDK